MIFFWGQVSSALYCLRQRNTYQGNIAHGWSRAGTNFADGVGGGFCSPRFGSQTCESGSHVNGIVDSSRLEARAMVDAAMQVCIAFNCDALFCSRNFILLDSHKQEY